MFRSILRPASFVVFVLASQALVACGSMTGNGNVDTPEHGQEDASVIELPATWSLANTEDFRSLARASDVVFTGTVMSMTGQRSGGLSPSGGSGGNESRTQSLPLSAFEVRVDSVVRGGMPAAPTVSFEQLGGTAASPEGGSVRIILARDELVEVGQAYLFFATINPNGSVSAPPFGRLKVAADGRITPPEVWSGLGSSMQLAGLALADAQREIGVLND